MHVNILHGIAQQHIDNNVILAVGIDKVVIVVLKEQAPSTDALTFKIIKRQVLIIGVEENFESKQEIAVLACCFNDGQKC
eukprot:9604736-Ditylum_brightwellii.AAC.1